MIITFDSKKTTKTQPKPILNSTSEVDSYLIKNNDFKIFKSTKRSKNGCVTCKTRKKKCDELKPTCGECARLNKQCIWIDYDHMNSDAIKRVKKAVEKAESGNKLRKRKSTHNDNGSVKREANFINSVDDDELEIHITKSNSPDISNLIHPDKDPFEMFDSLSPDNDTNLTTAVVHNPVPQFEPELKTSVSSNALVSSGHFPISAGGSPFTPNEFINYLREFNSEYPVDFNIATPDSPNFSQFFNSVSHNSPGFQYPISNSPFQLSDRSLFLYNYYVTALSPRISVAPRSNNNQENYYQKVFLPLAHQNEGIMHGLLAWSSFHMNQNTGDNSEGIEYLYKAQEHLKSMVLTDKNSVVNKLALLLVITAAEICRGDVKNWITHMNVGSKLFSTNGGLSNFTNNKQEFWLVANFAYHDVLSSDATERGIYFTSDQYHEIFHHDFASGILNPLVGIAKDIYGILGEIANLAYEMKRDLRDLNKELNSQNVTDSPELEFSNEEEFAETDSELSNHAKVNRLLLSVMDKAEELEFKIDHAKPNKEELIGLNEEEFEWQITLFETFKLSAKLYLRQSIFKCNPSTLESQILNNDLIKCLDIILGSPVESALMFPVFMSAIHCVTKLDRQLMSKRIDRFIKTYGPWSVVRAKKVIEKIWEFNPDGDKYLDWRATLKDMGWEINFA